MASSPHPLAPPDVEARLRAQFGEDLLGFVDRFGHAEATITPARYHELCQQLRDDDELAFDYCDFVGAVDRAEDGMELVTALFSTIHHHHVRVKVLLTVESPRVDTVSDLWAGANWHERETMEMFGVEFDGHPQPVKLLLPEPFEGHPLRKDFVLMSRQAKPWPGAPEGEEIEDDE